MILLSYEKNITSGEIRRAARWCVKKSEDPTFEKFFTLQAGEPGARRDARTLAVRFIVEELKEAEPIHRLSRYEWSNEAPTALAKQLTESIDQARTTKKGAVGDRAKVKSDILTRRNMRKDGALPQESAFVNRQDADVDVNFDKSAGRLVISATPQPEAK